MMFVLCSFFGEIVFALCSFPRESLRIVKDR